MYDNDKLNEAYYFGVRDGEEFERKRIAKLLDKKVFDELIREAKAKAWDEGHRQRGLDIVRGLRSRNPYREED